jgi:hypothetical protein
MDGLLALPRKLLKQRPPPRIGKRSKNRIGLNHLHEPLSSNRKPLSSTLDSPALARSCADSLCLWSSLPAAVAVAFLSFPSVARNLFLIPAATNLSS